MKRTALITLVFAFSNYAKGQMIQSIAVKTGLSVADQCWEYKHANPVIIMDSRMGIYTGISVDYLKSDHFNFVTDIGYCQKGNIQKVKYPVSQSGSGSITFKDKTYETRFDYLSLNTQFKLKHKLKTTIPYLFIGFRLDYQLFFSSDNDYESIKNDFIKTIWGTNIGIGLEFQTNFLRPFIDMQYQYDLTKFLDTNELEGRNSAQIFTLGLRYYFWKK